MNSLDYVILYVGDLDRSIAFYRDVLAFELKFSEHGYAGVEAQNQATAWIGSVLSTQVAYWAYIDVFWVLGLVAACAVPLALSLKSVKLGGGAPAGGH